MIFQNPQSFRSENFRCWRDARGHANRRRLHPSSQSERRRARYALSPDDWSLVLLINRPELRAQAAGAGVSNDSGDPPRHDGMWSPAINISRSCTNCRWVFDEPLPRVLYQCTVHAAGVTFWLAPVEAATSGSREDELWNGLHRVALAACHLIAWPTLHVKGSARMLLGVSTKRFAA